MKIQQLKPIVLGAFLLSTVLAFGQAEDSVALKYAKMIDDATLKKHLEVLASDAYEGRETGKKGQKMAMEYLINEFSSYGIPDFKGMNYQQSFPLVEQKMENISLKVGATEFSLFEDFMISPISASNRKVNGTITFYSNETQMGIEQAKGLFIWKSDTTEDYSSSLKSQLMGFSESNNTVFYYSSKLEGQLKKYGYYYKKPRIRLVEEGKEEKSVKISLTNTGLEKLLIEAGVKRKKLDKKGSAALGELDLTFELVIDKPSKDLSGENVIAFIEGGDKKEEIVVITAHYDHLGRNDSLVFNGADDDGTGTVSVIEIAQSFAQAKKDGHTPRRSILIMPVSGEEKGLLGSKYYTNHPVFPLENTVANLNIDMIGRYDKNHTEDSNYIYLIGSDKLSNELHEISEKVNKEHAHFNLDYTYNAEDDPNRFYYRSDHYNFAKNNVPVIFYFSGVHEDYHKSTDTYEKIDYEKTARVARLVFLTAWELANREERIKLNEE